MMKRSTWDAETGTQLWMLNRNTVRKGHGREVLGDGATCRIHDDDSDCGFSGSPPDGTGTRFLKVSNRSVRPCTFVSDGGVDRPRLFFQRAGTYHTVLIAVFPCCLR